MNSFNHNEGYDYNFNNFSSGNIPPKKSFTQKVSEALHHPKTRPLMLYGAFVGMGFDISIIFSLIYAMLIGRNADIYNLYSGNELFRLICEMLYSLICVALAFVPSFVLLNRFFPGGVKIPTGKPNSGSMCFLLVIAGLGLCFAGNIVSSTLSNYASLFGIEFYSYEEALKQQFEMSGGVPMFILTAIHTAAIPAFVEEFVFRGIVMQPLRKYGDWFAIITSAAFFGLMHGNMTQVPFAVIAGIALGYVSTATGSIWTGVLLHFMNNFISVIYSMLISSANALVSMITVYGIIIVGAVAFICYTLSNRNFMRLYPGEISGVRGKIKYIIFMPTFLFGIIYFVYQTLRDIHFV